MSRDLNPKIASYIQQNDKVNDTEYKKNVCDELKDIKQGIDDGWINEKSLFEFESEDQTISGNEFEKMIAVATGSNDYDSEARLLMRILDEDHSGDLSIDEAKAIMRDKSKIDTFSLWDSLSTFTEDSVNLEVSWKTDLEAIQNGDMDWDILELFRGEEYVKKLKEKSAEEGVTSVSSGDIEKIVTFLQDNDKDSIPESIRNYLTEEQIVIVNQKLSQAKELANQGDPKPEGGTE